VTIEEAIKQVGRQEGRQEGTVIGRIQFCQELLGLPVASAEDLVQRGKEVLHALLCELEGHVGHQMRAVPQPQP